METVVLLVPFAHHQGKAFRVEIDDLIKMMKS